MKLRHLLDDDTAVSPVIGVILMVAITVILAAIIGTFVLDLGNQVQSTTPQASMTFDYDDSTADVGCTISTDGNLGGGDGVLTVTHDGGETISENRLSIRTDDGESVDDLETCDDVAPDDEFTSGTSVRVSVDDGDTVRLVWTSENGQNSATLGQWEGPDA